MIYAAGSQIPTQSHLYCKNIARVELKLTRHTERKISKLILKNLSITSDIFFFFKIERGISVSTRATTHME